MIKVLANDGISATGQRKLEDAGFEVSTTHVPQDQLAQYIKDHDVAVLLVRSATTARKDLIDACPSLRFIGRGGVGMDNIDVAYAREKGLTVANTPASSSQSVAELVMAHLFSLARQSYDANRQMPTKGASEFAVLKKKYAKGVELRGKTLGVIGFGRIGKAVAQYALGCGMKVIYTDVFDVDPKVSFNVEGFGKVEVTVPKVDMDTLIRKSDAISIHVPKQKDGSAVIASAELAQMKKGAFIVNAARGGVVNEADLMAALDNGHIAGAALDVFDNEPTPAQAVLSHGRIALSPHVGAATLEAQDRIGEELADLIMGEMTPA